MIAVHFLLLWQIIPAKRSGSFKKGSVPNLTKDGAAVGGNRQLFHQYLSLLAYFLYPKSPSFSASALIHQYPFLTLRISMFKKTLVKPFSEKRLFIIFLLYGTKKVSFRKP